MKFLSDLIKIPHLDLGFQFPEGVLRHELENITMDFVPYETTFSNDKDFYRESWTGVSLIGTEDPREGMTEQTNKIDLQSPHNYRFTTLADTCPSLISAVGAIISDLTSTRVRIMRMKPGRSLGWHSHVRDHNQWVANLIIQIPLIMPENFLYAVTSLDNVKGRVPPRVFNEDLVHYARYSPGRAYVFNNFESHNIFNNDTTPRYSMLFHGNVVTDMKLQTIVEEAVRNYNGSYL